MGIFGGWVGLRLCISLSSLAMHMPPAGATLSFVVREGSSGGAQGWDGTLPYPHPSQGPSACLWRSSLGPSGAAWPWVHMGA